MSPNVHQPEKAIRRRIRQAIYCRLSILEMCNKQLIDEIKKKIGHVPTAKEINEYYIEYKAPIFAKRFRFILDFENLTFMEVISKLENLRFEIIGEAAKNVPEHIRESMIYPGRTWRG